MSEYIELIKSVKIPTSPLEVWNFINNMSFPVAVLAIGLLMLMSVQGYKIFKSLVHVIGPVGLAFVADLYLTPFIKDHFGSHIPANLPFDIDIGIALVCAIGGFLLAHYAYQFAVMVLGGLVGYFIGIWYIAGLLANHFTDLAFLAHPIAVKVVGGFCAAILSVIFVIMFKQIFIVVSSIGFPALACYILYKIILPYDNTIAMVVFVVIGAIGGFFLMRHQFEEEEKSYEIQF